MASQRTIAGAHVQLYVNGKVYEEAQQVNYTIDYGEEPIYGIDSPFPQEIKITRISITGSVTGVRLAKSNGLQGDSMRPTIMESPFGPYISIRITDRRTGEDLIFIPHAKVTSEQLSVSAKGTAKLSFNFTGLQPQQPLDRGGAGGPFGF
jgi:hypothetical protein